MASGNVRLTAAQRRTLRRLVEAFDAADAYELRVFGKPLEGGINAAAERPAIVARLVRAGLLRAEYVRYGTTEKRHGQYYTVPRVEVLVRPTDSGRAALAGKE